MVRLEFLTTILLVIVGTRAGSMSPLHGHLWGLLKRYLNKDLCESTGLRVWGGRVEGGRKGFDLVGGTLHHHNGAELQKQNGI